MIFDISGKIFDEKFSVRDHSLMNENVPFARCGSKFYRGVFERPPGPIVGHPQKDHRYCRTAEFLVILCDEFIQEIEASQDLLSYNYSYHFSERPDMSGGGGTVGGFKINGFDCYVKQSRGGAFLTVTAMQEISGGIFREIGCLDLRAIESIQTDDWGILTAKKKKAKFETLDKLKRLVGFIRENNLSKDLDFNVQITRGPGD